MRRSFLIPLCLSLSIAAYGQALLSPHTAGVLSTLQGSGRTCAEDSRMFDAYVYVKDASVEEELRKMGIAVGVNLGDVLTARIPLNSLERVQALDGVSYIELGTAVSPMLDKARAATHTDAMMNGETLTQGYRGKGVVVGVVDTGFDYTHPAFYDSGRNTLRIRKVWEQGTENPSVEGAARPAGFDYGTEFDTPDEILAAATDLQGNSHGTHVAGIAAGADVCDNNPYYGVAGDADLVLVSRTGNDVSNVNISDAIAYIYAYAEEVGKPCVINLSLGSQMGPHDGTSTFDLLADRLQGKGRLLIGSSGNFGAKKLHVAATGDAPVKTMIDYLSAPSNSNKGGNVDIWGEAGTSFAVKLCVVNKSTNEIVSESESFEVVENGSYTFAPASPTRGELLLTTEINPLNGKPHALVTSGITSLRSSNMIGIIVSPRQSSAVHLWADGNKVALTNKQLEGWVDGDTRCTIAEIGGTGKRIVSVGAYVTSHGTGQQFPSDALGGIASFSSRGPSADGRTKPDVTAPGSYIASALSSYASALPGTVARELVWNNRKYEYGYMEGTSMAAPFVTGVVAAWLQAFPAMTPEDLRTILAATSTNDDFTATPEQANGVWGYGKINALEGVKKALSLADASGIDAVPGEAALHLVVSSPTGWTLHPATPAAWLTATLSDVSGHVLARLHRVNVAAGDALELSAEGLPRGVYVLRVHSNGQTTSFKLIR